MVKKLQVETENKLGGGQWWFTVALSEEIPLNPPKEGALPTPAQHSMGNDVLEGLEG